MGETTYITLFEREGTGHNLVDLEETLAINQEYQAEVFTVDPHRLKTDSKSCKGDDVVTLKVSVKKLGQRDFQCSWEVHRLNRCLKVYAVLETDLAYFEHKTNKVKKILSLYHSSESLMVYLDNLIPAVQFE